jgi:hypothetical protein
MVSSTDKYESNREFNKVNKVDIKTIIADYKSFLPYDRNGEIEISTNLFFDKLNDLLKRNNISTKRVTKDENIVDQFSTKV